MIRPHGCTTDSKGQTQGAKAQDKMYGPGRRVMNPTTTEGTFRCTVCGQKG